MVASGTGFNLAEANHVIHYDLWWNPAVEAQATDRAFRTGQKKNVMVYRFITQATFEEKINEMILVKRDLANLTVTAGENWVGNLSNVELKEIFALRLILANPPGNISWLGRSFLPMEANKKRGPDMIRAALFNQ
jgi:SNF2 family DNA or RNA helicase